MHYAKKREGVRQCVTLGHKALGLRPWAYGGGVQFFN